MSRCRDGFCGADDCALCHPQEHDWAAEAAQADLDNDARAEREMLEEAA